MTDCDTKERKWLDVGSHRVVENPGPEFIFSSGQFCLVRANDLPSYLWYDRDSLARVFRQQDLTWVRSAQQQGSDLVCIASL